MPSIELNRPHDLEAPAAREKTIADPALTRRLKGKRGKEYWRSLEELADTKEFRAMIRRNFPSSATEFIDSMSRRRFLKLMGASLALAGVSGCTTKTGERIVPFVEQPENYVPGRSMYYATAMTMGGATNGLLVEQREGRPIKVEGNPRHPNSLGATDVFSQASLLSMYDPDRSETVLQQGRIGTYDEFVNAFRGELDRLRARRGEGIRLLTGSIVSPTLEGQIEGLMRQFPRMRLHQYEPAGEDNAREGARLAFGEYLNTIYKFDEAEVVLSLDADFLYGLPHNTRYIHDWATRRRPTDGRPMNRTYMAESTHTATGAKADHRVPMLARHVEGFAGLVAARLGVQVSTPAEGAAPHVEEGFLNGLVADLERTRGRSIVLAGRQQPAAVHALAHAMNERLGNAGRTVFYTDPVEAFPTNQNQSLRQLVDDMNNARVEMLVILGGNPVYTAPADTDFAAALQRIGRPRPDGTTQGMSVHLSQFVDETSSVVSWHVPMAHWLESWSDARTFDGTASIVQPLIEPLYGGRTAHEILTLFTDQLDQEPYETVRSFWQRQRPGIDMEQFFREALIRGTIPNTAAQPRQVRVRPNIAAELPRQAAPAGEGLEVVFREDPSLYDGRFANNGWLQELPKPISKLTWDNAVLINPITAREMGLKDEDTVDVEYRGRSLVAPVLTLVGQPRGSVTLHLGWGRPSAGRVGSDVGFNAYALRTSDAPHIGSGLRLTRRTDRYRLATTQTHHTIEGRDNVRAASIQEYIRDPQVIEHQALAHAPDASLYPEYDYSGKSIPGSEGYKWGMAVDMSTCTGCNACVIACEAENNSPVVGKDQVLMSREMHWLRVDSYFTQADENFEQLDAFFQPMFCVHCEKAPCEMVCPVEATVHSIEGLNDMVYNRCVGTKYCSNNCPYKVRRFNFLQYQDQETPSLKLMRNPEVTVRERGVMEKCTYCVQRIAKARINAEREDRKVGGDEIKTSCQAACPAGALVFGDLNQPDSLVARLHREQRAYSVLGSLNTQPRTSHLAALTNPNPSITPPGELETEESHG